MIAEFTPAGEILGPETQIRSIVLKDAPDLPDGEYSLVDTYCTDPSCDCRKTMIQILHEGRYVSLVNFGWESPTFYLRWLGSAGERGLADEMSGLSVDVSSPDRVSREGILRLMNHLLNDQWTAMIKDHYRRIRTTIVPPNITRLSPRISRNAPCPCGSGKKYKNCCL